MDKKELSRNLKNLKDLTGRNLKLKYASASLGILWAGLIPLLLMGAISFVFMSVLKIEQKNFHVFVLSGIIPWFYFSNIIIESTQAFVREKSFMSQFSFPKILFPLSITLANLIQHLIGVLVLMPLFAFYNISLLIKFPFLIIPILSFSIFLGGISVLIAITNLYIRDLEHLLGIVLMVLFWITPVFYHPSMIPKKYNFMLYLNPLSYFIDSYRSILLKGYTPLFFNAILVLFFSIIFYLSAFFIYTKLEKSILKKI